MFRRFCFSSFSSAIWVYESQCGDTDCLLLFRTCYVSEPYAYRKRPPKQEAVVFFCLNKRILLLAQLLDVTSQLALQVSSLVLVDDVNLSQLVQSLLNAGVQFDCCSLICCGAQLANSITHGLCVISVVESSLLLLTDSL